MSAINEANAFIAKAKNKINTKYRLNYHMMPPTGWMNDPNGLIYFNGKYHLFYQFNPYDANTGKMCWGHFESEDLVSYTDLGVAIMHGGENESVFSGGAVEEDGKLVAYYTLHTEKENKTEEVYKAVSSDGIIFSEGVKVFDNETLPENISRVDFRDPCPVKIGDAYYVFVGGKDIRTNKGLIVVLGGKSADKLEYKFCLGPYYELGDMGECPSYFKVGGKDVILASGCNVPPRGNDFKNINSSVFIVGKLDFEKGAMDVDFIKEIDKGDTFYAPQFIRGAEKPLMVGWFEMWNKPYPTRDMGHGWTGAFSIPREIEFKDGDIFQSPIQALDLYEINSGKIPKSADIAFEFTGAGTVEISGDNGKIIIGNDGTVYLENSFAGVRRTNGSYSRCKVRALADVSGIEVFVDGGREVISSRMYIDGDYRIKTTGAVNCLKIRGIRRKQ